MSRSRVVLSVVALSLAVCAGNAPAGLLHYWSFDDAVAGSTGTLADTVNSYPSAAPGAVAKNLNTNGYAQQVDSTTAVSGKAIKWPQYGKYEAAGLTSFGGTFTMETWFRWDANTGKNGNNRLLFGWGGVVGVHLNSSTLFGTTVGGVLQASSVWPTPGNPGVGVWTYLAVVADATAHTVTTYIKRPADTGLVMVSQGTNYNGSSTAAVPFMLGDGSNYTAANSVDQMAVWDTTFTTGELLNHSSNLQAALNAPEPATMAVLAIGGLGVLMRRRRR